MTTDAAAPEALGGEAAPPSSLEFTRGYRRYAVGVLLVIYVLNFLDRQIVNILAEPIRNELHLADWQLGMMTGLAFALFYTLLGFPVARIAERGDRPLLIGSAIGVWSAFTALCGLAQNFWQLLLLRVGVGIGEAGCTPPAVSLIADYTPKEERATAMSMYALGSPVGTLLGLLLGGLIADVWGWRAAFFVVGLPGLLFALVARFTLREPRRRMTARFAAMQEATPPLREALKEIAGKRALWLMIFGGALKSMVAFGMAAFISSFFLRNHGPELAAAAQRVGLNGVGVVGVALALATGVSADIGAVMGGRLVDHFAKRDVRAYARIPALGMLLSVPFYVLSMLASSAVPALLLMVIPALLSAFWSGPIYGAIQGLVRPRVRATATASLLFTTNLVGLGLGPLAMGLVSDFIAHGLHLGAAEGVKWSILLFNLLGIPAGWLYWSAAKTIREEMLH